MKAVKILGIVVVLYILVIVLFESLLGYFQPAGGSTLVITTTASDGGTSDRVLQRVEDDGTLYVSANHWPRAWYHDALDNANVLVALNGDTEKAPYLAVPVQGAEHDRLSTDHAHGLGFRILTGFPPRYFLRLDPQ